MNTTTKSVIKYVVAIILLYVVLRKTEFGEVTRYFKQISPLWSLFALGLVIIAQIAAAMRMRFFFISGGFDLGKKFANILFFVGSFYNFILPGGIGGDAYKVVIAKHRMEMPTKQGIRIMVADRASGLCVMLMIGFASLYYVNLSVNIAYANLLIIASTIITSASYFIAGKILLKKTYKTMLLSLPYSFVIQSLWVGALLVLLQALGTTDNAIYYVILYCAASIASMLPISVGGLGIKEMTYFHGAALINQITGSNIDGELGVALSLCIFILSFVSSIPGLMWLHEVTKTDIADR